MKTRKEIERLSDDELYREIFLAERDYLAGLPVSSKFRDFLYAESSARDGDIFGKAAKEAALVEASFKTHTVARLSPEDFFGSEVEELLQAVYNQKSGIAKNMSSNIKQYLGAGTGKMLYIAVDGDSMTGAGIEIDDVLAVERTSTFESGDIVLVAMNGVLAVKRLRKDTTGVYLASAHPGYAIRKISSKDDYEPIGIVRGTMKLIKSDNKDKK